MSTSAACALLLGYHMTALQSDIITYEDDSSDYTEALTKGPTKVGIAKVWRLRDCGASGCGRLRDGRQTQTRTAIGSYHRAVCIDVSDKDGGD